MADYMIGLCTALNTESWTKFVSKLFLLSLLLVTVDATEVTDFVGVNVLPDGEIETRIHYNGISAKETTVSNRNRNDVKFRQLTDGRHFIQLIYENETIQDCEYVRQRHQIITFLKSFKDELRDLISTSNITINSLDDGRLPQCVSSWLSYPKLRKLCRATHKKLKAKVKNLERNGGDFQLNRSRNPRHASFLLLPGTLWCGHLDSATKYTDLGHFSGTDNCCRKHDQCKRNVHGFSRKYGFYNSRPFTISHCFCDASFRTCLKMVGTSDANLVGKIFFNVVQTKCFILKPKKVCKKSWWGKCSSKKYVKRAVLRENMKY